MIEVSIAQRFTAPAPEVWRLIRDFNALPDWIPGIRESRQEGEGVGCTRRLDIAAMGGRWVIERLECLDDVSRELVYTIVDGSLPLKNYTSTMKVVEIEGGDGCELHWHAIFDAKDASDQDAKTFVQRAYGAGIEKLKARFGS